MTGACGKADLGMQSILNGAEFCLDFSFLLKYLLEIAIVLFVHLFLEKD